MLIGKVIVLRSHLKDYMVEWRIEMFENVEKTWLKTTVKQTLVSDIHRKLHH